MGGIWARLIVENGHQINTCYNEIEPCTQILDNILCSIPNIVERGSMLVERVREFKLWIAYITYISISLLKLEVALLVICDRGPHGTGPDLILWPKLFVEFKVPTL